MAIGSLKIKTTGQTLSVSITGATAYSDVALQSPVSMPNAITADTTYYFTDSPVAVTVSVTTKSGVVILNAAKVDVRNSLVTLAPLPSAEQVAVRVGDNVLISPNGTAYRVKVDNAGTLSTETA